jgi:hypothetical protein
MAINTSIRVNPRLPVFFRIISADSWQNIVVTP